MGKLNRNNKGFGGIELLLIIVVVVLLGVVGWFVYKHDHKTVTNNTIKNFIMESTTKPAPMDQNYLKYVTPSQITSNPVYIKILNDLHSGCVNANDSYIGVDPGVFDINSNNLFMIDGNYAFLELVLCSSKTSTTRPDWTTPYYIKKDSSGVWKVADKDIGGFIPKCTILDSQGYPKYMTYGCQLNNGTYRAQGGTSST
jgi:hypothetical protein